MNRRLVATSIIALAVLFSQGGGSALAAICPHLRSLTLNNSCHEMQMQEVADNHDERARADGEAFETNDTTAPCNHCAVHSRTRRDDSTLQPPNASQRASDLTIPIAPSVAGPPSLLRTNAWVANAHGPPRDSGPLHLLNNVFRI
jgi:hypothetical protein